jgi:16S rRNA (cytidine1402-2'-O)-methyltransferase
MTPAGTLYLIATPIGNLEDITLRAIRILKEADVVACEDTRHTRGLLAHLGVRAPTVSLHEHNEHARIPQILGWLRDGKTVALVSDAGTPAISDPGAALVGAAAREGFGVVSIPGASAVTAAVTLADFPAARFAFVGFLPRRRGERRRMLEALSDLAMALVIFEAPHRVGGVLGDIAEVLGERRVMLVREMTKMHEDVLRGTAAEVREALGSAPRGEITLVVEGASASSAADARSGAAGRQGAQPLPPELLLRRLLAKGLSRRDAARVLEVTHGMPSNEAYRLATKDT